MSETIEYEARTLGTYDLEGKFHISLVDVDGKHVVIKCGPAQTLMLNAGSAASVLRTAQTQEAEDSEFKAMFRG